MNVDFTNRFAISRQLGIGGMGIVYAAHDRERNERVALKTLKSTEPSDLYRLKSEFRSLADISHPNLVRLHELFSDEENWFFTMELVEGVDFLSHIRNNHIRVSGSSMPNLSTEEILAKSDPEFSATDPRPFDNPSLTSRTNLPRVSKQLEEGQRRQNPSSPQALSPVQLMRLRTALGQLAEGLHSLHHAGKIHRDVKPSNVLVANDGRVVLLDFGLAREIRVPAKEETLEEGIAGTVAYMAPEQAAGRKTTPASDWYSVGVMLFEALTGRRPFLGPQLQVLMDKQQYDAPPPRELVKGVPQDLDLLAVQLLRRDPDNRPTGSEILRHLGKTLDVESTSGITQSSFSVGTNFVGRREELQVLRGTIEQLGQGCPIVVNVAGRSGFGKSAIVEEFKRQSSVEDNLVLLSGRCYERESVPYKAMDSLVDSLSRFLGRLPGPSVEAVLPRDTHALSRLFPVLGRVSAVAAAPRREASIPHQQEQRQRAFAALRELLARLGDRQRLILTIDDLQWGDLDSIALLNDLLRPPDPPVLILIAIFRSEDESNSPVLKALREFQDSFKESLLVKDLKIDPLSEESARDLALNLLDDDLPQREELSKRIAHESAGHPYFINALVQHYSLHDTFAEASVDLDTALWEQVVRLPDESRRLLEVISVAGHPIRQDDAFRAAELTEDSRNVLDLLRVARLVRTTGTDLHDEAVAFHDRIRETVTAHLSSDRIAECHRWLAASLEAVGTAEPAVLAAHFLGADDLSRAGEYYAIAADRSTEALAFDRAAELYRLAIDLWSVDDTQTRILRTKLADSLANAGRGGEAAQQYRVAAKGASAAEVLELRRRAATQSLISGHIDDGIAALDDVLATVGLRLPKSPQSALLFVLIQRSKLALRGLNFQRRDTTQISAEALAQIDIYWSVSTGLSIVDTIRAAGFQTRGLMLALRAGEPYRIARSLTLEAAHIAVAGQSVQKRVAALLERADSLAHESGSNHAIGLVSLMGGLAAFLQGRWRDAIELCDRSEAIFRDECTGVVWELTTAQGFSLWSLFYAGEVAELGIRVPKLMQEARERGNLYALNNFGSFAAPLVYMAADEPDRGRRELENVTASWSQEGYHVQHLTSAFGRGQIDLYVPDGRLACKHIEDDWPGLRRSMLLRIQQIRIVWFHNHGRAALAAAVSSKAHRQFVVTARQMAGRLEREKVEWGRALATLLRAGIAAHAGKQTEAIQLLETAAAELDKVDMCLFAASARRQLGRLLGGDSGAALIRAADDWMTNQNIKNPARMAAAYAPGFSV